jgi:hypothetical protein
MPDLRQNKVTADSMSDWGEVGAQVSRGHAFVERLIDLGDKNLSILNDAYKCLVEDYGSRNRRNIIQRQVAN